MNAQRPDQLDHDHYLSVFRRLPVTLVSGEGSRVVDDEGREYIDLLAGIAVNNVGHCHPQVAGAIAQQAQRLIHVSNFFLSPSQAQLAARLAALSGLPRAFFSNSGAEAVEGAMKLARKHAHVHGRGGTILCLEGAFHGRTLATIAAGKPAHQEGFGPLPGGFEKLPAGDLAAARERMGEDVAAILVEPVQGEGGVHVLADDYLRGLRELCDGSGALLVMDEVQTGVGRTGRMFAFEHSGVRPDILSLAKALGGGFPVAATLCTQAVDDSIAFGDHGTTFGGNPLACAAALAVLDVVEEERLVERAASEGEWLRSRLREGGAKRGVVEVRGRGLMVGVELAAGLEAPAIVRDLLGRGVIANATGPTTLRLVPALNIPREELARGVDALFEALDAAAGRAAGEGA